MVVVGQSTLVERASDLHVSVVSQHLAVRHVLFYQVVYSAEGNTANAREAGARGGRWKRKKQARAMEDREWRAGAV